MPLAQKIHEPGRGDSRKDQLHLVEAQKKLQAELVAAEIYQDLFLPPVLNL